MQPQDTSSASTSASGRVCSQCGTVLLPRKNSHGMCKSCAAKASYAADPSRFKARSQRWRDSHPEEHRAYSSKWAAEHPEEHKRQGAQWQAAHPEKVRASSRKWRQLHPETRKVSAQRWDAANPAVKREAYARYRARKKAAFVETVDWWAIWQRDGGRCRMCGEAVPFEKMERDHIWPLAKGGTHEPRNAQTLCRHCNRTKSASGPGQLRLLP